MTIGIGLLVDTLIVRSFMTPSIAAALGRWFWWPLNTFKIVKRGGPEPASDANTAPILKPPRANPLAISLPTKRIR
jgi:RND superfamily putative drug exporter